MFQGSGVCQHAGERVLVTIHQSHVHHSGLSISLGSLDPLREEFVVGTFVSLNLAYPVAGTGSDRDRSLFSHTSTNEYTIIKFMVVE